MGLLEDFKSILKIFFTHAGNQNKLDLCKYYRDFLVRKSQIRIQIR
jgi:hypothetical protein